MMTFEPATEERLDAFRAALPVEDAARERLDVAVEASLAAAVLCAEGKPIALLGVSKAKQAWMHSVPTFDAPMAAFRAMRRRFREWADEFGEVWCAMKADAGRQVRVMGLIERLTFRDGFAYFVLKGHAHVR